MEWFKAVIKNIRSADAARRSQVCLAVLLIAGGCAALLMFWITENSPGISADSCTYIDTARNLLAGNGFTFNGQPMTHFPPVYPLLLAGTGWLVGGDVVLAARLLCAFFFGLNLVLFGYSLLLATERSILAALCAVVFYLSSASILTLNAYAWSESPFIAFTLGAFLCMAFYCARPRFPLLIAAAICASLALATRYIGLALLPPLLGLLFLPGERSLIRKLQDALFFLLVGSLGLAAWVLHNLLLAHNATNRSFAIHLFGDAQITAFVNAMYSSGTSLATLFWARALNVGFFAFLFLAGILILIRKKYLQNSPNPLGLSLTGLCLFASVAYIVFLFTSISFFDASTIITNRIILPVFMLLSISFFGLTWSVSRAIHERRVWVYFMLLVLLTGLMNAAPVSALAQNIHDNGIGYTTLDWKKSETVASARSLPGQLQIYTNGPDVLQFYLPGRDVTSIPALYNATSLTDNQGFRKQMKAMCKQLGDGSAYLVLITQVTPKNLPAQDGLVGSSCPVPVFARLQDGVIYGLPPK